MKNHSSENRMERLQHMEGLLLAHTEGLTQAEIARQLGVHRSTVMRDLAVCPFPLVEEGRLLWIDRESYLVNVHFTLHEALAVHLAARLLANRMDRQNPHAASALCKLGLAMEGLAPHISGHLKLSAEVMGDQQCHRFDPRYLYILEQLTLAWAEQRKVEIWYRKPEGVITRNVFCPYFIEPNAIGQSIYVIGLRESDCQMRTFKVERIEQVVLLREPYEIPLDFNPRGLLEDAWGIWFTTSEPVEVVLRFAPRVAGRVMETRWHRSEEVAQQPDGSLVWRARVAEPREMLPWIRGWGADAEVLEPPELRRTMVDEAQRLAKVYGGG